MIMKLAVPAFQHSPLLGQLPDEHIEREENIVEEVPITEDTASQKTNIDMDIITQADFESDILDWDEWFNYD